MRNRLRLELVIGNTRAQVDRGFDKRYVASLLCCGNTKHQFVFNFDSVFFTGLLPKTASHREQSLGLVVIQLHAEIFQCIHNDGKLPNAFLQFLIAVKCPCSMSIVRVLGKVSLAES